MKAEAKKFYDFVLARTKATQKEEMKRLLATIIERKQTNKLDKMYLMSVVPRALSYLEPDSVDEVKKVVTEFATKF